MSGLTRLTAILTLTVFGSCLWPVYADDDPARRSSSRGLAQEDLQEDEGYESEENQPVDLSQIDVEVSDSGLVTLNASNTPLDSVLQILSMRSKRNIIATPGVVGTVTASLHDVTFEEALDAILVANNAGYRAAGKFIYVYTDVELQQLIVAASPPESRVFHLSYIPASEVQAAIAPLLSPIGNVSVSVPPDSGLGSEGEQGGGQSLSSRDYVVVFDRPDNLEAVAKVISELDIRPRQVLVEATILSADLTDDNALGVDFTVLGGVDLELLGSTSTAIQDLTVGDLPSVRLGNFNSSVETQFNDNVPDGGVSIGIIKDQVAVFIRALEQVTDTVVLANPKVLALNKQKGQVIVGRRDGYLTTTVTETQAVQDVEFLETGTQLIFRPFIGQDDWIRMELHPEDSIGGLTTSNLPYEQTTEVTTNVMVKDGQTILIGGLFRETSSDSRSQVPLLGDIPVLGKAFQSQADHTQRQEVMILLTVHVIKDNDVYAEQSAEQWRDIERIRVGIRNGMMKHGREQLAQALYGKALDELSKGNQEAGLWYTRMALHNNARLLPAIELQEDLRRQREWAEDGSITRKFIYQAIMREQGVDGSTFGRPLQPKTQQSMLTGSDRITGNSKQKEAEDVEQ